MNGSRCSINRFRSVLKAKMSCRKATRLYSQWSLDSDKYFICRFSFHLIPLQPFWNKELSEFTMLLGGETIASFSVVKKSKSNRRRHRKRREKRRPAQIYRLFYYAHNDFWRPTGDFPTVSCRHHVQLGRWDHGTG